MNVVGSLLSLMNEHDILGASSRADRRDRAVIAEWGTIGWPDDGDPFDYGPAWDDGMTLAKVTLYRGRKPGYGKPLQPGLAAGARVLAHIDARLWKTLDAGTRVCVIFPRGDVQTPANGFVAFVAGKSPAAGFDASTMMLPIPDGSTLNIGDANAVFVAKASPVQTALDALKAFANKFTTATSVADVIAAGNALYSALGAASPSPITYTAVTSTKGKIT